MLPSQSTARWKINKAYLWPRSKVGCERFYVNIQPAATKVTNMLYFYLPAGVCFAYGKLLFLNYRQFYGCSLPTSIIGSCRNRCLSSFLRCKYTLAANSSNSFIAAFPCHCFICNGLSIFIGCFCSNRECVWVGPSRI